MKIAVLGDIHSNYYALSACVKFIDDNISDIDCFVFLGDSITDCPNTRETLDLLYRLNSLYKCLFIKGNREEYLIDLFDGNLKKQYSSSLGSISYTLDLLRNDDINFIRQLPISSKITFKGYPSITFCHGSPTSTTEHIYPNTDSFNKSFSLIDTDILVAGHNHFKSYYRDDNKIYINPDAVSFVTDYPGVSRFALIELFSNDINTSFYDVKYDNKKLLSDFIESGLLEKGKIYSLAMLESIKTGKNLVYECAVLGHKFAKADGILVKKLSLPEEYWEKAAKKLKLI